MIYQVINYEDEKLLNIYDLYERNNGKQNYICDGDSMQVKVSTNYDFARVKIKKIPPKKIKKYKK